MTPIHRRYFSFCVASRRGCKGALLAPESMEKRAIYVLSLAKNKSLTSTNDASLERIHLYIYQGPRRYHYSQQENGEFVEISLIKIRESRRHSSDEKKTKSLLRYRSSRDEIQDGNTTANKKTESLLRYRSSKYESQDGTATANEI
ncbi:hypothetical protein J6590_097466 [Homalodisca vitripennis]|nr:hypothetical protein J6590_095049 [Homalodisca vitripennis]KAG8260425.1 hypothetical protein J6590_097466 [Homalodisca vitripennis]